MALPFSLLRFSAVAASVVSTKPGHAGGVPEGRSDDHLAGWITRAFVGVSCVSVRAFRPSRLALRRLRHIVLGSSPALPGTRGVPTVPPAQSGSRRTKDLPLVVWSAGAPRALPSRFVTKWGGSPGHVDHLEGRCPSV